MGHPDLPLESPPLPEWKSAPESSEPLGFIDPLRVELHVTESCREWCLTAPLRYHAGYLGVIEVPAGFCSDFASIPWWIKWLFPNDRYTAPGAVLHDWIYRRAGWDRRVADALAMRAWQDYGVPTFYAWLMWAGVRIGGWAAFKRLDGTE